MDLLQACNLADDAYENSDIFNSETDTHVRLTTIGTELYVTFRGTQNLEDAINDAKAWLVPAHIGHETFWVHDGFWKCWLSVREEVFSKIMTLKPSNVHFGGHSMGGAESLLAFVDYMISRPFVAPAYHWSMGCPRVFGVFSAKKVDSGFHNLITRWRNEQDEVTHVPPVIWWRRHVGNLVQIGNPNKWVDDFILGSDNAHMVASYRKNA